MTNEQLKEYVIDNGKIRLSALNYGACITGIYVKDKYGTVENVVASFENRADYITNSGPYLNAAVGPVAGRIAYGQYIADGKQHQLSVNCGKHHLHGGASGISMKYFQVEQAKTRLHFHLETTHEEDGFPGGSYVYDIDYRLKEDHLLIELHATPPQRSLLSMTNHLYFNLSGELKESICHHELRIDATQRLRIHPDGHPDQIVSIVPNNAYDFHELRRIKDAYAVGDEELKITNGYDTPFLMGKDGITLLHRDSGRGMHITSDAPGVVVYSANYFEDSLILNQGRRPMPYPALALEPQDVPNAIHLPLWKEQCFYDQKHPFHQTSTYRFYLL